MQTVVAQQKRLPRPPDQLCRIGQHRFSARKIGPTPAGERHRLIQKRLGRRDHLSTAFGVIAARPGCTRQCISAVKGIIQAPPTRIGRVQHKARVEDRHHKLRARHRRDFGVDVLRANREGCRLRHQIADLAQERLVHRLARLVTRVDLRLQCVAFGEQGGILWSEAGEDIRHPVPPIVCINAQPRQHRAFHKLNKFGGNAQSGAINDRHDSSLGVTTVSARGGPTPISRKRTRASTLFGLNRGSSRFNPGKHR